jgi:hypothetical protein
MTLKVLTAAVALACGLALSAAGRTPVWKLEGEERLPGALPYVAHLDLTANGRGNAVAVWSACEGPTRNVETGTSCRELHSATRSPRGVWRILPAHVSAGWLSHPQVTIGPRGDATALWIGRSANGRELFAVAKPRDRHHWSAPEQLTQACDLVRPFEVGTNRRGAIAVAWICRAASGNLTLAARVRVGDGRWGDTHLLATAPVAFADLVVAVHESGDADVAWSECGDNGPCQLRTVTYAANDRSWGPTQSIQTADSPVGLSLAVGPAGRAFLAWWTRLLDSERLAVQVAVRPPGSAWDPPVTVATPPGPADLFAPAAVHSLSLASAGRALAVAWGERIKTKARVQLDSGRWTPVRTLSLASQSPRLAATARGQLLLSWLSTDATLRMASAAPGSANWATMDAPSRDRVPGPLSGSEGQTYDVTAFGRTPLAAWIAVDRRRHVVRFARR